MLLSVTPEESPDVNGCVDSQTPEDFTAHLEMHPLKHTTILITLLGNQDPTGGSLQEKILKKTPLGVTHICCGVMCLNPILHFLEEPKWPPMPTKKNHTSLQGIPQNTKESQC
jgi:hypothetical protein